MYRVYACATTFADSFTSNGEFEGEVVFAGYGLKVPGKAGEGFDSYAGLDVTSKSSVALYFLWRKLRVAGGSQQRVINALILLTLLVLGVMVVAGRLPISS